MGRFKTFIVNIETTFLDSVGAVTRLIAGSGATDDDNLFYFPNNGKCVTITRAMKLFNDLWKDKVGSKLTGNSCLVGGASLR